MRLFQAIDIWASFRNSYTAYQCKHYWFENCFDYNGATKSICGFVSEDPNAHLAMFLQVAYMVKLNKVGDDAIQLRLLCFSLRDKALNWLYTPQTMFYHLMGGNMVEIFEQVLSTLKYSQLKSQISQFKQQDCEPLHEMWEKDSKIC